MFNSYQAYLQNYSSFEYKYTESIDILNDFNFVESLGVQSRSKLITTLGIYAIPNTDLIGSNLSYNADTYKFTYIFPIVPYEFKSVNIKAIKTVTSDYPIDANSFLYNHFITCCSLAPNITKRVNYNNSNLDEGVNFMPINQSSSMDIWFMIPDTKTCYNITTLSQLYDNIIIELDFIVRK